MFAGNDNATPGASPTVPPLAPVCTLVDIVSFEVDINVTFRTPVNVTLSPICVSVTAGTWFNANEAPTPTSLAAEDVEFAVAALLVLFWAVIVTSGDDGHSAVTVAPPRIAAWDVFECTRLTATEPATPTLEAFPAPERALAPNVCVDGVVAERLRFAVLIEHAESTVALLSTESRLTATATPTPGAAEPVALPSAVAVDVLLA